MNTWIFNTQTEPDTTSNLGEFDLEDARDAELKKVDSATGEDGIETNTSDTAGVSLDTKVDSKESGTIGATPKFNRRSLIGGGLALVGAVGGVGWLLGRGGKDTGAIGSAPGKDSSGNIRVPEKAEIPFNDQAPRTAKVKDNRAPYTEFYRDATNPNMVYGDFNGSKYPLVEADSKSHGSPINLALYTGGEPTIRQAELAYTSWREIKNRLSEQFFFNNPDKFGIAPDPAALEEANKRVEEIQFALTGQTGATQKAEAGKLLGIALSEGKIIYHGAYPTVESITLSGKYHRVIGRMADMPYKFDRYPHKQIDKFSGKARGINTFFPDKIDDTGFSMILVPQSIVLPDHTTATILTAQNVGRTSS